MRSNSEYFFISVSSDRMKAFLKLNEMFIDEDSLPLAKEDVYKLLEEKGIKYGILNSVIENLKNMDKIDHFPKEIALGKEEKNGQDGKIEYHVDFLREYRKTDERSDFRNVIEIPSVEKGEKLATLIPPTEGESGYDVYGQEKKPIPGKKNLIQAGKNVEFDEKSASFYAKSSGEVKLNNRKLEVESVYEVYDSISMKTGNIDFVGTVIVHGDVPSGFKIKADGDIKVNGLVEAAELYAGGSIYIAEGLSSMKKGFVFANKNLYIGYINQGNVHVGESIFVENSILHSNCIAGEQIICENGNIIGGINQAGTLVEAKDIGNRLNTKTNITFGLRKDLEEELKTYKRKQKQLKETKEKLILLGKQLEKRDPESNTQVRIALLRQKNKVLLIEEEMKSLSKVQNHIKKLNGKEQKGKLYVREHLYPNTIISFGKYENTVRKDYYAIEASLEENEITFINR